MIRRIKTKKFVKNLCVSYDIFCAFFYVKVGENCIGIFEKS